MKTNIYYPSAKEQVMSKLGSIITVNSGRDYKHLDNGNIPVFGTGGIIGFVSKDLYKGDAIGIGRKGTINKPFILKGPFWTVDTLFWCTINDSNSIEYVFQLVKTIDFKKYDEGSTLPSLSSQNIKNISVRVHDVADQVRIGNLLASIDNLINTQNNIILSMRLCLDKNMELLFNKRPRSTKLYNLATIVSGSTPDTQNAKYWNGDISWFTPTEIGKSKYIYKSKRKITIDGLNSCSASILKRNSILLTTRATIGELAICKDECATNQGFQNVVPFNDEDTEFLYYCLRHQRGNFIRKASGSTFLEINKKEISKTLICDYNQIERKEIGELLASMDKLIELEEKKLEKLELMKKYYLQQIFD